jgi:hypothetical protein
MDVKELPAAHKQLLCGELTEDFYYIDEIKQKYVQLVPDADPEAINPYNLRMMGFQVLSRYVLQNQPSLEAYFRHLLLQQDVMDIIPLKKRFAYVMMWHQTLNTLKNEYEIMEFEPHQIINIRKLNKSGITKAHLRAFCDWAHATMPEGTYFSGRQLRMSGTNVGLYDLGFSDWFYAKLVASDPRFSFSQMFGSVILYRGKATISIRSFLEDRIRRAGKIDIYDLMTELEREFGCKIEMKSDITAKLQGSDVYFDPILERFYANQELYYRELDEDPEVM